MIKIVYPLPTFKIKSQNKQEYIFDVIRKKWVLLTPEEWVRQNFIAYLVTEKKYPTTLFAIEKEIQLGELKKRCDIVVYRNNIPWLIVECKEMNVSVNEKTIEQILNYNQVLQVHYLILTNGTNTYGFDCVSNKWLSSIPNY